MLLQADGKLLHFLFLCHQLLLYFVTSLYNVTVTEQCLPLLTPLILKSLLLCQCVADFI